MCKSAKFARMVRFHYYPHLQSKIFIMRRKTYWKEICLLVLGFMIGTFYSEHYPKKAPVTNVVIQKDSINIDTLYVKVPYKVPPLTKENLKAELIRQKIPQHSIVLAQAIHETGNFTSRVCKENNNLFGLRKGNTYRSYSDYSQCVSDYKRLISSRYKGGDYYGFLLRIGVAS